MHHREERVLAKRLCAGGEATEARRLYVQREDGQERFDGRRLSQKLPRRPRERLRAGGFPQRRRALLSAGNEHANKAAREQRAPLSPAG